MALCSSRQGGAGLATRETVTSAGLLEQLVTLGPAEVAEVSFPGGRAPVRSSDGFDLAGRGNARDCAFEVGRPVWLDLALHGAPFALLRFRIFPSETLALQATYRLVPITTDDLWVREHDLELAMSYGFLQLGARLRVDEATGGEPIRTYRSIGGGLFVAFAAL